VPANQVGYTDYYEAEQEQGQQEDWSQGYEQYGDGNGEQSAPSDYSGAVGSAYAPTDSVSYGYGTPHRAPPQYLPSVQRRREAAAPQELCLLEADMHVDHVSTPGFSLKEQHEWWTTVRLARGSLDFKVDTGAKGNVCSLRDLHKLGYSPRDLVQSNVILISFTKKLVQPVGTLVTRAHVNGVQIPFVVHVVRDCNSPLLSLTSAVQAQLVSIPVGGRAVSSKAPTVDEFSAYKDEVISLQVKATAVPKQFPLRRVVLALQDQVHFELTEMVKDGILEPVTEATEWCHPMLVTPKPNGRLRVCMDPRYLNEYLIRAVHPFPDVEQVFASISGSKFFAKIDLTHGFWNLRLDDASSNLCVFSTPWGRYRYKRLPFGVSPAPEVFHRVVADVIRGLPNVIHYIDDILIFATTRAEHDQLVQEILRRLKAVGFSVCRDKCAFGQSSVTFLGHQVSGDRIRPDPLKLEALLCMQPPTNLSELQSFLGLSIIWHDMYRVSLNTPSRCADCNPRVFTLSGLTTKTVRSGKSERC
jgi:hypothetical protein